MHTRTRHQPSPRTRTRPPIPPLLFLLLLLLPLGGIGCGPQFSIPDTPSAALAEGKKREEAAQQAETARSAQTHQLWQETASYYNAVGAKFTQEPEGLAAVVTSARITDEKLENTYGAWVEMRNALKRRAQASGPAIEKARADFQTLETKLDQKNSQQIYYKIMDALVRALGNDPKWSPVGAIVLIALFVTVGLWPLRYKQYKSMKELARYQPEIKKLQDKYKGDPGEMAVQMQAFNRRHGINPMAGCLPAVAQMPVFILMYQVILHYQFHFTNATFLWINPASGAASQSWPPPLAGALAHHLGEQDMLLLLVYAVSIFVQMKLTPAPVDPSQAEQQRFMTTFMPIMYFMMMLSWQPAAAFVLYWFISNLFSMGQQWLINRSLPTLPPLVIVDEDGGGNGAVEMKSNPRLISPKNQKKGGKK